MLFVTMEFLMGTTDFHAYPKFMHRVIHILFIVWMMKDTSIFPKLSIISGLFKVDVV